MRGEQVVQDQVIGIEIQPSKSQQTVMVKLVSDRPITPAVFANTLYNIVNEMPSRIDPMDWSKRPKVPDNQETAQSEPETRKEETNG